MSSVNITGYQNGTSFINVKNEPVGFTFIQTLFLTIFAISSLLLFSTLVYYVIRKRALDELRHRLVPLYHFDPAEREDWEDSLLDDSKKETQRNATQYYRSMSSPIMTTR